jgi:isocitrate dehydrogenase
MAAGDFYGSEQSHTMASASQLTITLRGTSGTQEVLKTGLKVQEGEEGGIWGVFKCS